MNKILIATALALAASSSLAFAAKTTTPPASFLTTEHCSQVEQTLDRAHYKSESAYRVAEEKAMSLCREDKHKNHGVEFGSRLPNRSLPPRHPPIAPAPPVAPGAISACLN